MVEQKLKTVRVQASMSTGLYVDINVPANLDEGDLYDLIRNYELIDGGNMTAHSDSWGDWTWEEEYDIAFNSDAMDMSGEIKKLLENNNG